jgi:glutamate N-acetyltransferase/amino-acid N-acetyltransferase
MSTSDSVFMIASGAGGASVQAGSDDEALFARALDALLKQLAIEVVADGEGASRIARLEVHGGTGATEPVARSVANSPLVKCALFGADPNWGRILQAAGQALPDSGSVEFDLSIEDVQVAQGGVRVTLDDLMQRRLDHAMQEPEVDVRLSFGGGGEQAEIYFSDLGHDYVSLNSAYST